MRANLIWKHFLVLIAITLCGLFVISKNVGKIVRTSYRNQQTIALEQVANTGSALFLNSIDSRDFTEIQRLCAFIHSETGLRITVIDPQGKVLADSDENPEKMVNHINRKEIRESLTGVTGMDIRPSETLGPEMMYVAVPIIQGDQIVAVLRTSVAMSALRSIQDSMFRQMFHFGIMVTLVFVAAGFIFTLTFNRHMVLLRKGAERFARGDFSHRLDVSNIPDIAEVSQAMNTMAMQLDERIRAVTSQKNEQQAMLSSMVEGVIAVNGQGYVLSINAAAADMLQISKTGVCGRSIEEVIRNKDLQTFVKAVMNSDIPFESQIVLHEQSQSERYIQAHGSALKNERQEQIGGLVVLNDVTHIRKLEQVRSDFVANVSHELKTPVTSIKGFIETLLDGASHSPDDTHRFLEIVRRQTDRLNSIIDDLLMLSRIEQHGEEDKFALEPTRIKQILAAAASLCAVRATEKNIRIRIECAPDMIAHVNASLLEQAVVNLVDNAIKYSSNDGIVCLEAAQQDQTTLIHVSDKGCGIAKEHLPRIFERFYRVDKARSRSLGGTGLGLAIVKHIANAHKGTVTVESTVGQGSRFTIKIPSIS